jgi:hypothetical protein
MRKDKYFRLVGGYFRETVGVRIKNPALAVQQKFRYIAAFMAISGDVFFRIDEIFVFLIDIAAVYF